MCFLFRLYEKQIYLRYYSYIMYCYVNEINNARKRKNLYQCTDDLYFENNDR